MSFPPTPEIAVEVLPLVVGAKVRFIEGRVPWCPRRRSREPLGRFFVPYKG
jgi:hypothetical protein